MSAFLAGNRLCPPLKEASKLCAKAAAEQMRTNQYRRILFSVQRSCGAIFIAAFFGAEVHHFAIHTARHAQRGGYVSAADRVLLQLAACDHRGLRWSGLRGGRLAPRTEETAENRP